MKQERFIVPHQKMTELQIDFRDEYRKAVNFGGNRTPNR
jgi:hypothetical protein